MNQVVNLVVLLFFIIVGAIVEVLVSIILGAFVCVLPLVVFAMFSPTTRSTPFARTLRERPVTLLAVIVCASGFMVLVGAAVGLDLVAILIGLVLFLVGLAVLAPRLQEMQRAHGSLWQQTQPSVIAPPLTSVVPDAAYGQPPAAAPYSPAPPVAPSPAQYPPSPPSSAVAPSAPMPERYCPACGAGNARTYSFCQKCGRPLPSSP